MGDPQETVMGYPLVQGQPIGNIRAAPAAAAPSQQTTTTTCYSSEKCIMCNWFWLFFVPFIVLTAMNIRSQELPLEFEVDSLIVAPFNISSSHITATWYITFSIRNPNPNNTAIIALEYPSASVLYKKENIIRPQRMALGKRHREGEKLLFHTKFGMSSMDIESWVAETIAEDLSNDGAVKFTVEVTWMDPEGYEDYKQMSVSCEEIRVGFSSTGNVTIGTMLGGSRTCTVSG